ncbi:hypothetical protein A0128_02605 [Leptospira tipperaryensis]|uniref:Uncharacterized protein n=1 Tax=Leptospira tipperaryensis TaxID=2564040 RepID=A0A1D7UTJ1_9LEPT|nr:hypothetical protein A0128_02605 [Leptospira tipperaryensis]
MQNESGELENPDSLLSELLLLQRYKIWKKKICEFHCSLIFSEKNFAETNPNPSRSIPTRG